MLLDLLQWPISCRINNYFLFTCVDDNKYSICFPNKIIKNPALKEAHAYADLLELECLFNGVMEY